MGNEIATKHSKSDIDQFPQIRPLSPQDNFSTKHPQSPQNFPPNHLFAKSPPERNLPIRPIIFYRVPAPTRSARSATHQRPKDFSRMPMPVSSCPCCLLPDKIFATSGRRRPTCRAWEATAIGLQLPTPIGQESSPLSGRSRHPYRGGVATPIGQEAAQL